jgi:tetratricopeptide (TPR) repeat protein
VYHSTGVGQVEYRLPAVVAPVEVLNDRPAGRRSFEVNRHAVAAAPVRERPGLEVRQKASPTVPGGSTPTSNLLARARARKFISFGDELFRKQRFHEALQQYQTAATAAPDWAEPYFRQGHALVATHRLDPAADAFKRALALHPDRDRNGFRLNEVYGDNLMAKTAHAETLAAQALARPHDADTFFLLGLFLFYDDQAPRAEKFFARAHTLAGGRDAHLRPFLLENRPAPILLAGHAGT